MHTSLIPIYFPHRTPLKNGETLLAADIGGTKADMALVAMENNIPEIKKEFRFGSADWDSILDLVKEFCKDLPIPKRMSISFAGPIKNGKASGTNIKWGIDSEEIKSHLNMDQVFLLNDLEANCYGLAALKKSDIKSIYDGEINNTGNGAVISPGTGLGEGGLYWDGNFFRPFATEGGHAHFAPRNELDWRLFKYLAGKFGHVSWERVVSGMGICNIFEFLRDVEKMSVPKSLEENFSAPAISQYAQSGVVICEKTLHLFSRYLAEEAANLAMKFKTTGGLFIGGGIIPKIWVADYHEIFNDYFFAVGRLNPLVKAIPVSLILNQKTALLGAVYYGAFA